MRPKRLGELSVREEADRCISCSAETSLERVDGGRINDTLIKAVPSVNLDVFVCYVGGPHVTLLVCIHNSESFAHKQG